MNSIRILPLIISSFVLGAHFYRADLLPLVILCLNLPFLLLIRSNAVLRLLQVCLILGSLEWLRTIYILIIDRQQFDQPWTRLAIILGLVALCTALSALPLSSFIKERRPQTNE